MFSWNPHQKLAHFQVFYRLQKLALINFSRPDTVRPPPSQIQLVTRTLDVNFQPAPTACEQTSQQLVVYRTQFVTPFGQWVSNKNLKKGFHYFLFVFLLLLIDFLSSAGLRLQKKKKTDYAPVGWVMVSLEIGVLELAFSSFLFFSSGLYWRPVRVWPIHL